ncbi:hypothetical protein [Streptomyces boninensis]|uniref:hypothetical protein n=1 Tax=Streptomyces boninensis TaxID=2039455 RepID=UPI003B219DC7
MTDNEQQEPRPFHTELPPEEPLSGASGASGDPAQVPAFPAHVGIPANALAAYRHAEASLMVTYPESRIGWQLLAGMGMVASEHARGGALDEAGTMAAGAAGPERGVGPMGFDPSVWALWGIRAARIPSGGRDGVGEGAGGAGAVGDPMNIYDAALSAGLCLCAGGGDLRDEATARGALEGFDAAEGYADAVIAWTESYALEGSATSAVVEADALGWTGAATAGVASGGGGPYEEVDEAAELIDAVSAAAWVGQLAEAEYAAEPNPRPDADPDPDPDSAPADRDTALLPAVLAEFVPPEQAKAAMAAATPALDPHEQPGAERWVIRAAVGVVLAASVAFGVLAVQGPDGPSQAHQDQADSGEGVQTFSGAPSGGGSAEPTAPSSSAAGEKKKESSPDHDAGKAESDKQPATQQAAGGDGARPQGGEDAGSDGGSAGGSTGGGSTGGGSTGGDSTGGGSDGSGGTSGGGSGGDGGSGGSSSGGSSSGGGGAPAPSPSPSRKLPGTDYYDWTIWVPGMH